jgi:Cu+-exporting ATPase
MNPKDSLDKSVDNKPIQSTAQDPVCGMNVDTATHRTYVWKKKNYYFCSDQCLNKFKDRPDSYLLPKQGPTALEKETIYTCPMHPQIRKIGPGNCPICGMTLELETLTTEHHEDNSEYKVMLRRFWICLILSVPLLFITMGGRHFFYRLEILDNLKWVELLLSTPVVLWGGWPFFIRFWQSLLSRHLNMFSLIGLGVSVSYTYSLVALLFPNLFPPEGTPLLIPLTSRVFTSQLHLA